VHRAAGDIAVMTISDDGTGFLASPGNKRQGLGLVRRLVEQVRGNAIVDSENGTAWTINIPVPGSALPVVNSPNTHGAGQEAA
jgi:two-component sensor histidine kinase